jgi:hypothetical protein
MATTKRPFARERLHLTNAGVSVLTPAIYNDSAMVDAAKKHRAGSAKITFEALAGDVHYTEDGSTPTTPVDGTGVGSLVQAKGIVILESYEAIAKFKAIATSATAADADVVYYR